MTRQQHNSWRVVGALVLSFALYERAAAQCEFQVGPAVTASDGLEQDMFGASVALDGTTAVMGAPGDDHAGDASGSAYVFLRSAGVWVEQQKLTAVDAAMLDAFGTEVALSGNIVLVGTPGVDDLVAGEDAGAVYVFNRAGTVWTQTQKLLAPTPILYEEFGRSVAMDTATAIIGAPFNTLFREESGSVYIFIRVGAVWSELDNFGASDNFVDDGFGYAVALSGSTAVVGTTSGGAYVFLRTGDTWNEQQKLLNPDGGAGFGLSVAVRGDVAMIGAPLDGAGSVYVFTRSLGVWTFQQKLTSPSATSGFGNSVAMEGTLAVIGASLDDTGAGAGAGATYLFRNTGGVWAQESRVTANNGAADDQFGSDVALNTGRALVGAMFGDNTGGANSGSAYVFDTVTTDCNANGVTDVCDIANGTSADCNANGLPDECDIAQCGGSPSCRDCNANGVPDGCDIADATSPDCNTNGIPDECDIAGGASTDCNANAIPDECQCFVSAPPEPDMIMSAGGTPVVSVKNRFLSFVATETCTRRAARLTIVSLPGAFGVFNGTTAWIGLPQAASELPGKAFSDPIGTEATFNVAQLVAAPVYTDWSAYGVVHVHDERIIPSRKQPSLPLEPSEYQIQFVADGCDTGSEANYSSALGIINARWGDVAALSSGQFRAPDGSVEVTADVLAVLAKFSNAAGAPIKARAEMVGTGGSGTQPLLTGKIDISDVLAVLGAFTGGSYPFPPPP